MGDPKVVFGGDVKAITLSCKRDNGPASEIALLQSRDDAAEDERNCSC